MNGPREHPPGLDRLGEVERLEAVLDADALAQVCRSFFDLFNLSIRFFSRDGALLADVHEEQAICRYVNELPVGARTCGATVSTAKAVVPEDGTVLHPCFTGAVYRIVPVEYQGRMVGRFIIGPYLPAELAEVPRSLLEVDPAVDAAAAQRHLAQMPRVKAGTAERIAEHLRSVVDLILFSSHRAQLAREMHVASVRESYRELLDKNAKLQRAYDQLKEVDRLKSTFLATVSHELRTPLTSIIGYSEMLEGELAGPLNEEQREFVQTIRSKGDHLLRLISSLLDLSKLEQGNLPLRFERLDVRALLQSVAATLQPNAQKAGVEVHVEVPDDLPTVEGDPVRIQQVLQNLADNAVKFTETGGRVVLSAHAREIEESGGGGGLGAALMATPRPAVAFTVRDTGMGIPRHERERIFDAFYQVDGSTTRQHGGAGLGLSIVRRLVEAHGGTISVESAVGEGTTFTVVIPEPRAGSTP
ncbi:MAG: ATP-binding protein [Myxococcota bacterium]